MLENVLIYVDNVPYDRWQNLRISYSLNTVTSVAKFSAPDNPSDLTSYWLPQSEIRITSNGDLLFVGNIHTQEMVVNSRTITTELTARSLSSVITDSSPPM